MSFLPCLTPFDTCVQRCQTSTSRVNYEEGCIFGGRTERTQLCLSLASLSADGAGLKGPSALLFQRILLQQKGSAAKQGQESEAHSALHLLLLVMEITKLMLTNHTLRGRRFCTTSSEWAQSCRSSSGPRWLVRTAVLKMLTWSQITA